MWKRSSKPAGAVLILTLLLSGGCATAPGMSAGQGPVDVTPALREHYHQAIEAMKAGQWETAIYRTRVHHPGKRPALGTLSQSRHRLRTHR